MSDDEQSQRADAVKEAFTFAFTHYYQNAFPNDQLNPLSNTVANPRYEVVHEHNIEGSFQSHFILRGSFRKV